MATDKRRSGPVTTAESFVFDFEEKVDLYVRSLAKEHATKVLWWDMHGEHVHLTEFKHMYNRFKVTVRTNSIAYGEFRNVSINSKLVHTEWFHNGQCTDPQQVRLTKAIQRTRSEAWRTERGLSYGKEPISLDIGVPKIGLNVKFPLSDRRYVSINHSKQQEHTETYMISVDQNLTVRPKTSLKIDWVVTDIAQEAPWTSNVTAEGYFAVWFYHMVNNHYLWFYPVTALRDPLLTPIDKKTVQYISSGWLTTANAIESYLRVSEYDLISYGRKPLSSKIYAVPLVMHVNK